MAYRYNGGITPERMNVFLNMLYGDVPEHLAHIEKYAEDIHAPIMRSQTGHILKYFLKNDGISSVLEIGTAIGYSALYMLWCNENIRIDTIEKVPMRIEDARENAKLNGIENTEFFAGDVEKIFDKIMKEKQDYPDVVIVDPPRKGLDINTVETLLAVEANKIVYISCNPATMVRDMCKLSEKYEIGEIQPVDMFPFTSNVECCAVLYLK